MTHVRKFCQLSFKDITYIDFMFSKWIYISITYINFERKANGPCNVFTSFVPVNEIVHDHDKGIEDTNEFSHLIFMTQLLLSITFLYYNLHNTFMIWCVSLLQFYIRNDYKVLIVFMNHMKSWVRKWPCNYCKNYKICLPVVILEMSLCMWKMNELCLPNSK